MWLVFQQADQVLGTIIHECVKIPPGLLKAADVYCSQCGRRAHTEFIGTEADDGAVLLVEGIDGGSA